MIRLSGPRCLAMSAVGVLFGWWASLSSVSTMTHYRGLSHEALLVELAETNEGGLSTSIVGGLFVVAAIVIATDVLTRFFKAIWLRIEPQPPRLGGKTTWPSHTTATAPTETPPTDMLERP